MALAVVAALVAVVSASFMPSVSPLLVAILLGMLVGNVVDLPARLQPGLKIASKRLLRLGIVLLGLRISLGEILGLGWSVVGLAAVVVCSGMVVTWVLGAVLGLKPAQRLLIGAGFSICGAAAVAAVEGSVEESEPEDVVTALALVVLFGTLMIPAVPLLVYALGVPEQVAGVWAGASIHEVAQVVAVGGIIGTGALQVAVVVKLIRVLMLAPVIVSINLVNRRRKRRAPGARTPLVPVFILGFIGAVLVRSYVPLPEPVFSTGQWAEAFLLSAAMFALGCGVHRGVLRRLSGRTLLLATAVTGWVAAVGLAGAYLLA